MKTVYDPIYGFISITPLMKLFIDTPEFQRLRELRQLGAVHYVFPSANHTRFEHSLGVSYLAGKLMKQLKERQPKLEITDRDIELTRVAGLLHDIGHGPFSHIFDNYVCGENEPKHEERGIEMIKRMVYVYNIPLSDKELQYIVDMIDPPLDKQNHWKYQIIANKINSIDVDKMDYIQRDCFHIGIAFGGDYKRLFDECRVVKYNDDFIIAWSDKCEFDLYSLLGARYRLHKQVLSHHAVKAYEYIIIDILKYIIRSNPDMNYSYLTDSMVTCRMYMPKLNTRRDSMFFREHYQKKEERIVKVYNGTYKMIQKPGYIIDVIQIGFVSDSDKHPLLNIVYYNHRDVNNTYKKTLEDMHMLFPLHHQETILRLYMSSSTVSEEEKENMYNHWNKIINNTLDN